MIIKKGSLLHVILDWYYMKTFGLSAEQYLKYSDLNTCKLIGMIVELFSVGLLLSLITITFVCLPLGMLMGYLAASFYLGFFPEFIYSGASLMSYIVLITETILIFGFVIANVESNRQQKRQQSEDEDFYAQKEPSKVKVLWDAFTNRACQKVYLED